MVPEEGLVGLRPRRRSLIWTGTGRRLASLKSKRRLTSRFRRIENVKNFDVEKWYHLKV